MLPEPMLVDGIIATRAQIDFLWQFFITVHIAIFALLLIYDDAVENLNFIARALALGGIGVFEWINGKALTNTYLLLDAFLEQYRALYGQVDRFEPAFFQHFVQMSFADRPGTVLVTHTTAFVVILLALVSRDFIQSRKRRRPPNTNV
ncbi:MAG: hypothetical protein V3R26_04940 [Hyphomicrobium sp.]|jgi:hypothetical protein